LGRRDALNKVLAAGLAPGSTKVAEVMRPGQIALPRARVWSPLHVRRHKLQAPHYARAALSIRFGGGAD
jgi:hypothetical protein